MAKKQLMTAAKVKVKKIEHPNFQILQNLEPQNVFQHFYDLSILRRGSGKEHLVARKIKEWATAKCFKFRSDKAGKCGNIAIDIPASQGFEKSPRTVVQAHMDMVEASSNPDYDWRQGVILEKTGDKIHSKDFQTTIGADDGLGVAMILAMAESKELKHGPLTLVFTVQEEVGLWGIGELDEKMIPNDTKFYINVDAEEGPHGFAKGSAGGIVTLARWEFKKISKVKILKDHQVFTIKIKGMLGGHSGVDVHKGHGNALKYVLQFLAQAQKKIPELQLIKLDGGLKMNIIPPLASCQIAIPKAQVAQLQTLVSALKENIYADLGKDKTVNVELNCSFEDTNAHKNKDFLALENDLAKKIVKALSALLAIDGVLKNDSHDFTLISSTTAILEMKENCLEVTNHARAAVSEMGELRKKIEKIRKVMVKNFAKIDSKESSEYAGWYEPENSVVLLAIKKAHRELFGDDAQGFIYHAGVEVGVLADKVEAWSGYRPSSTAMGPLIEGAHSVRETFHISSVKPTYELLKKTLEVLAKIKQII